MFLLDLQFLRSLITRAEQVTVASFYLGKFLFCLTSVIKAVLLWKNAAVL